MVQAARKTAVCGQVVIAACLLCGLAGCQADRGGTPWVACGWRPAWLAGPAGEREATCAGPCRARCIPCGGYQPTVWESWNSGPMAVRCGAAGHPRSGSASTQPDPDWLRDLPKPGSSAGDASPPESVPPPHGKARNSAKPGIGSGFKLRPTHCAGAPAVPAPALNPGESPNTGLGEGFQLQPGGSPAGGDKPALKGLETPPEGLPPIVDRNDGASRPVIPHQGSPALPPLTVPSDKKSAAPPDLVPVSPPPIN